MNDFQQWDHGVARSHSKIDRGHAYVVDQDGRAAYIRGQLTLGYVYEGAFHYEASTLHFTMMPLAKSEAMTPPPEPPRSASRIVAQVAVIAFLVFAVVCGLKGQWLWALLFGVLFVFAAHVASRKDHSRDRDR
jgi:hypothetical protein